MDTARYGRQIATSITWGRRDVPGPGVRAVCGMAMCIYDCGPRAMGWLRVHSQPLYTHAKLGGSLGWRMDDG